MRTASNWPLSESGYRRGALTRVTAAKRQRQPEKYPRCNKKGPPMRRVLACISIAAAACLTTLPTATAEPDLQQEAGQPVINEVQTRGAAGTMDQFIEIANASRTEQVDLSGWFLQIYSNNNTVLQTVFLPEDASLLPMGAGPAPDVLWTLSSQS